MQLKYAQLSLAGPVRTNNEDYLDFWQAPNVEEIRLRGMVVVLADGVGGQDHGEVASRLAVDTVLQKFKEAKPGTAPNQLLWHLVNAANTSVYDAGMQHRCQGRMATTLVAAVFRNNEVTVAHVGDSRAYLIQQGRIRQLTTDHTYVAQQVKLGLISEQEAASSEFRNVLMRSLGKDLTVQVDISTIVVNKGDFVIQCSDGLHGHVTDAEMMEIVTHVEPEKACQALLALAIQRGTEDNLSVQVARIDRVEQLLYYRGLPIYQEAPDLNMSTEVQPGQILDGRFRILELIGRSGMASIYKGTDLTTGKVIALKVPFMQFESDPGFFSRFEREEAIGKALDHPNILHIISVEDKSRPYIAMEFLQGQTLRQVLQSMKSMPVADALSIGSRLCEALEYMHSKDIVHRDLKPENIMLCSDGSLRIMDFGIAKAAGMRRLTFTGFTSGMGTPDYMAPEQVKGKRGDNRTDIYSLGAMLYEMLTGSTPFEGGNPYIIMNARLTGDPVAPRKVNPDLSPQIEEILLHAMEREPANRYASAAAMKTELDAPEAVHLTGRHERLQAPVLWKARWQNMRLVVLAVLIPLVVFGVLLLIYRRP